MNKAFELLNITLFTVLGLMPIPRSGNPSGIGTGGGIMPPIDECQP